MTPDSSPKTVLGAIEFQLSLLNLTSTGADARPQVEELRRLLSSGEQNVIARN